VRSKTPEWGESITGVPAEQIRAFARLYGGTKRAFIRVGYGFSRTRNGAGSLHAVSCLPTVTGAWQHKGGGALYSNRSIYRLDNSTIIGLDMKDPSIRQLDQCRIGAILTGDKSDLGDGPPVTAMLIQNTNPAVVCPDLTKVHRGFAREDLFVAVHEQFMTETAALADIVLPATTFLEHDDIYRASGHSFLQVTKKVVEPYAEARPNHYVICELAKRLGCTQRGFFMSEWELIDDMLAKSGWPGADEIYAKHWQDCMPEFETAHFLDGFGHPDKKFHFHANWVKLGTDVQGMSDLPDFSPVIDAADDRHPFRLVAAPARQFLNSTFTETPGSRGRERRPTLLLHPEDAQALGIAEGGKVEVGNKQATISLHAGLFDGLQRGVVVIESIWPNADFPGGLGVNALTSADPGKPGGGAVFHDTAVWVRSAA
jgi:anaerobic selenocysteine-containing dehydrogenase